MEVFLFPLKHLASFLVRLYPQSQHAFHSREHRNAADKKEGGVLCSSLGWQTGGLFCAPCLKNQVKTNNWFGVWDWWYAVRGKGLGFF